MSSATKTVRRAAIGGALVIAAAALTACASDYYASGVGYGYEDYAYAGHPYCYGDVNIDGSWYSGPVPYRTFRGERQYYLRGNWRPGVTRSDQDRDRDRDRYR